MIEQLQILKLLGDLALTGLYIWLAWQDVKSAMHKRE